MNTANDIQTADAPPRCAPSGGSESGEILKACPLCDGGATVVGALGFFTNNLAVRCKICELETKSGQFETEAEVISFWNKRPGETSPAPDSDKKKVADQARLEKLYCEVGREAMKEGMRGAAKVVLDQQTGSALSLHHYIICEEAVLADSKDLLEKNKATLRFICASHLGATHIELTDGFELGCPCCHRDESEQEVARLETELASVKKEMYDMSRAPMR